MVRNDFYPLGFQLNSKRGELSASFDKNVRKIIFVQKSKMIYFRQGLHRVVFPTEEIQQLPLRQMKNPNPF